MFSVFLIFSFLIRCDRHMSQEVQDTNSLWIEK